MTDTKLRRLAENATPGPWRFDGEVVASDRGIVARSPRIGEQCAPGGIDDPRYIAAASPDVILALIERCERAERERDEARYTVEIAHTLDEQRKAHINAETAKALVIVEENKLLVAKVEELRSEIEWIDTCVSCEAAILPSLQLCEGCAGTHDLLEEAAQEACANGERVSRERRERIVAEASACEGCGAPATGLDSDGVPLCDACGNEALRAHAAKGGE